MEDNTALLYFLIAMSFYRDDNRVYSRGPFDPETDLLYCRLGPNNELVFEAGVISEQQNRHYREKMIEFRFEVETIGLPVAQYLDYKLEIDKQMIGAVHHPFIFKYHEIMEDYFFGPNPKPTLSPDMLMYLHFEWFKVIRAAHEENILSAAGVDKPIPRIFDGLETQHYFRERVRMRREGCFGPLKDEPWPPS